MRTLLGSRSVLFVTTIALGACIFRVEDPNSHPRLEDGSFAYGTPDVVVDRGEFPKAMALLDESEKAIDDKRFDEALAKARAARTQAHAELDEHADGDWKDRQGRRNEGAAALERVEHRAILFEGLAARALGHDVDAIVAIHADSFAAAGCDKELEAKCKEHEAWLRETFPGMARESYKINLGKLGTLKPALTMASVGIVESEMQPYKGWVGVILEASSSKKSADGKTVTLRLDGEAQMLSATECTKIGNIRIDGDEYGVNGCHEDTSFDPRANFEVTVPADDVAEMTGKAHERFFVVFERKQWRRTGNTFSAGKGRVAWVDSPVH